MLVGFGRDMQYPSMFQIMEPDVFLQQPMRGIVGILCSFEDEQYLSNSINPLCLITKYPIEGIGFLVGFGKVM